MTSNFDNSSTGVVGNPTTLVLGTLVTYNSMPLDWPQPQTMVKNYLILISKWWSNANHPENNLEKIVDFIHQRK